MRTWRMAHETFIRAPVSGMQTKCPEEHTSSAENRTERGHGEVNSSVI